MILNYDIYTDITVNNLMDLKKLKYYEEETNLKINASDLARKLGVDRRTIRKYIEGYEKPKQRKRKTQFDEYYETIEKLLKDQVKIFKYKSVLYRYLTDNYGLIAPESSFRHYISSVSEFQDYFINNKHRSVNEKSAMRFETDEGKQGQVDWKESMDIVLVTGETININIFVFLLSFSRFRIYRLSLTKTRDILRHFLSESFETIGGVPEEILFDNMKTVMDVSRTRYFKGKINDEFQEYANDYGFKVKPCIAARAQTKGKVESPMRILDELYAYNGDLTYEQLVVKVTEINNRENSRFHESYQAIPILGLEKEKDALLALPSSEIRRHHKIKSKVLSVNKSSMISFNSRLYSVPPKYISKRVNVQYFDNQIHIYYNTELIALHNPSEKHLNYQSDHYKAISKLTLPFEDNDIEIIAKNNLKIIGARYE